MSTQVELLIKNARLSYPNLFQPGRDPQTGETRGFGCQLILDRDNPSVQAIKEAQRAVANGKWGPNGQSMLEMLQGEGRLALKDGNKKRAQDGSVAEGYADKFFVSANCKARPTIVEERDGKNVPLAESDGRPYGGCYVDAKVAIWVQDPKGEKAKHGKRINCQLMGIKFKAHGDAFGGAGRVAAPEEFGIDGTSADAPAPAAGGESLI